MFKSSMLLNWKYLSAPWLNYFFLLLECQCNQKGSKDDFCDADAGKCTCKDEFTGNKCDQCVDGTQDCHGNLTFPSKD